MGYMDNNTIFPQTTIKGNGQSILLNPDETFVTPHLQKDLISIRIKQMVKAAKDLATHQWAVPILLILLLGYWVISDQKSAARSSAIEASVQKNTEEQAKLKELLLRLDQQKIDGDKQHDKDREDAERVNRETLAYITSIRIKLGIMEGKN